MNDEVAILIELLSIALFLMFIDVNFSLLSVWRRLADRVTRQEIELPLTLNLTFRLIVCDLLI